MVDLDITQLGLEIGGSAAIGAVIGFAAKKVAKVIAVIIGIELILFKFLESRGILEVNWGRIVDMGEQGAQQAPQAAQGLVETFIGTVGVGVGFAGGFALGFKKA